MRIAQIEAFVAVANAGSLRAASRGVGLSQPAMTKSLRQLEQELQSQLLVRTARGVSLTAAGRAFLCRARVIQAELRRINEDLAALRGGGNGSVAMGIAPPFSLLVPEAMARFREVFPSAHVRIIEGVRTALLPPLREGVLDFAIGQNPGGPTEPGLRFKPLLRPALAVAARKGHPLAHARSLHELSEASWLVFNPLGTGGVLERLFADAGLAPPRAVIHCEAYATALALIAQSDVLGLLFRDILARSVAAQFFQRIPIRESIASPSLGMFTRADVPLAPAASAMAQAMAGAARRIARQAT